MNETGIIILAAGNSSRLGSPKQLLLFKGKPLLRNIVDEAANAELYPMVTVLGYEHHKMATVLSGAGSKQVYNPLWEQGMASGIVAGMHCLLQVNNSAKAVIIAVCDQPFVDAALLRQLVSEQATTGKPICACFYAGTAGVPVLFRHTLFNELLALQGAEGARSLLKRFSYNTTHVAFENGAIDVDTVSDYNKLCNKKSGPEK